MTVLLESISMHMYQGSEAYSVQICDCIIREYFKEWCCLVGGCV